MFIRCHCRHLRKNELKRINKCDITPRKKCYNGYVFNKHGASLIKECSDQTHVLDQLTNRIITKQNYKLVCHRQEFLKTLLACVRNGVYNANFVFYFLDYLLINV